jgi:hypothetical protein
MAGKPGAVSDNPDAVARSAGPDASSAMPADAGDRHFVTALARGLQLQLLRCFRSGQELPSEAGATLARL